MKVSFTFLSHFRQHFFAFVSMLVFLVAFGNGGCAGPRSRVTANLANKPIPSRALPVTVDQVIQSDESKRELLELDDAQELEGQDPENLDDSGTDTELEQPTPKRKTPKEIPFEFNQKVAAWIHYFSQKDRERFQRFLDRGEAYREVIEDILEENRVPGDLYYLGMIESGFALHAKSSASAVGPWQFMKATGKMFGLRADSYVDERRDPIRATEAAASYLRSLHREFKSWYLALAAYNAGPGRIRGAIRRGKTNDFWELVERKKLPRETMEYVPKFMAARYIGEHPELFAFYINEEKTYPAVELVKVPSPVRLETIEAQAGLPEGSISFVNPQYLKGHTHPFKSEDEIWVPEPHKKKVAAVYDQLRIAKVTVRAEPKAKSRVASKARTITVKKGDNLKKLARQYGLSVAYLKRVNNLKTSVIVPGQKLNISATAFQLKRHHPRKKKK